MMNTDEFEMERETSAPIDMLEHYFSAHGWAYERNGDEEIVATFQGSCAQYELLALCRADDHALQFTAFPDILVAAVKREHADETFGHLNPKHTLVPFDSWHTSVHVLFTTAAMPEGETGSTRNDKK